MADGLGQRPVGEAELFRGEQSGPGPQGTAYGGFRVAEAASGGAVEGDPGEGPGEVQGRLRGDGDGVGTGLHRVQPPVGRHEQDVGDRGVRDTGQLPVQGAVVQPYGRERRARAHVQAHGEDTDPAARRQCGEQFVPGRAGQQRLGGHHGAGQERHRGDRAPQFLQHHRGFTVGGALAAPVLGNQQAGEAHAVGEHLPQGQIVRGVRLAAGDHTRRVAVVGEQVPDGGAQRLFLLRVQQVRRCAHRARSFQATSLSVRGSAGRPSTRSATMFSRTSLVPPSMLLPLARR